MTSLVKTEETTFARYVWLLARHTFRKARTQWIRHFGGLMITAAIPAVATYLLTNDRRGTETTLYVGSVVVGVAFAYEVVHLFFLAGRDLLDAERQRAVCAEALALETGQQLTAARVVRPYLALNVSADGSATPFRLIAARDGITATNIGTLMLSLGPFLGSFDTVTTLTPGDVCDVNFRTTIGGDGLPDDCTFAEFVRAAAILAIASDAAATDRRGFNKLQAVGDGGIVEFRLMLSYQDFHDRYYTDIYNVTAAFDRVKVSLYLELLQLLRSDANRTVTSTLFRTSDKSA
jgi:hypothetical protein